ncbi:Sugar phosphate permease [Desulfacinum infernum DSM 9756]|uniref:Sugar phosphate permease n=1 Tax=Desulfacinum infernum DSM 9756 TaxID=1121391 RepID=A0A1M5AH90_9BACT|nr:MFS transporter [Desulfacinum infernum]SHF29517.1 Sugar phosphate permease [Desulfacinum infernum DSM 9756]
MTHGDRRELLRYRWYIFATLAFAYLFVYFHRLSLSVVAEELAREFSTSAGALGFLGSVYFYCYAFMQFPAGLLSDSIGPRKAVSAFTVVAAAGSVLFGTAPHLTAAFAGRFLVGMGAAMVFIPTMKILSQWFRPREFAFVSGILNAVGGLGILAATWLLARLTTAFGWRLSFQLIGGVTLVIAGLVWAVVRDRPEAKGWPPLAAQPATGATSSPGAAGGLRQGVRHVLSSPQFWLFSLWSFVNYGIFFGFGALWSGPYLMHTYGMDREQAGSVLSMIAWGMIFGSPALGFLSDRVLRSRKKPLVACALAMTLELGFLRIFPSGLPTWALMAFFLLFSISSSSTVVIAFTAVKELFPIQIAGTALGSLNLFPFLGGAVAMPLLGWILDRYAGGGKAFGYPLEAYTVLLSCLFLSSLVVLACTFFMRETYQD